jgi:hypothetical protein
MGVPTAIKFGCPPSQPPISVVKDQRIRSVDRPPEFFRGVQAVTTSVASYYRRSPNLIDGRDFGRRPSYVWDVLLEFPSTKFEKPPVWRTGMGTLSWR